MVLVSGMRSMQDLVIMSYALVAWWGANRLASRSARRSVRILHVMASYLPAVRYGGTIVSVHGLCQSLAARGHDVHVFTTSVDGPRDSAVRHGVPVNVDGVKVSVFPVTLRAPSLLVAADGRALGARWVSSTRPYPRGVPLAALGGRARRRTSAGIPYVVSPRGMIEKALIARRAAAEDRVDRRVEKTSLERAAAIHVTSAARRTNSPGLASTCRRCARCPTASSCASDGGGARSPAIRADRRRRAVRVVSRPSQLEKGPRPPDSRDSAHVSRISTSSSPATTRKAFARRCRHRPTSWRSADRVVFTGAVAAPEKQALLTRARLLVLPSYSENFGNVVVEAMAAGCAVVVTPEVGIAPAGEEAGAGWVVDGDPDTLGTRVAELSANRRIAARDGRARTRDGTTRILVGPRRGAHGIGLPDRIEMSSSSSADANVRKNWGDTHLVPGPMNGPVGRGLAEVLLRVVQATAGCEDDLRSWQRHRVSVMRGSGDSGIA